MQLSTRVLGAHAVHAITDRLTAPILVIGSDRFHRSDLARIDCFHFFAASNLSRELQSLRVKNTKDLFERIPPAALVLPRVGCIALAVLGAAFEAKGIGGDQPLEAWVTLHRDGESTREFYTFDTLKAHRAKYEREHTRPRARGTRRRSAYSNAVQ